MDRRQADILVADLAAQLGSTALALDENGMCVLGIDNEKMMVSIGYNRAAGALELIASLNTVEPSPARIAAALMANFKRPSGDAASLATEPSSGTFVLQRRWLTPDLGDGGLPGALLAFLTEADAWNKRLAEVADDPDPAARGPAPDAGVRA